MGVLMSSDSTKISNHLGKFTCSPLVNENPNEQKRRVQLVETVCQTSIFVAKECRTHLLHASFSLVTDSNRLGTKNSLPGVDGRTYCFEAGLELD